MVEVEVTNADEGKVERYADLGVRELWLLDGRASAEVPRVEFLALQTGKTPRRLASSNVLPNLTPEDVSEAVGRVRLSVTRDERTDAVARIVLRRQAAVSASGRRALRTPPDPDDPNRHPLSVASGSSARSGRHKALPQNRETSLIPRQESGHGVVEVCVVCRFANSSWM